MQITMWRTTKRDNSTATPSSKPNMFTNPINFDVKLKEETSVLTPTFILNIAGHDGQNYLQAFGRYYWVTNIRSLANNLWAIDCKIDPLGSYRGHIRNTSAFVLYDSTANSELPDPRLAVKTTPTTQQNTGIMPWDFVGTNGTYFIAIEGDGDLVDQNIADAATGVYRTDMDSIQQIGLDYDMSDVQDCLDTAMMTPFPLNMQFNTTWGSIDCTRDLLDAIKDSINNTDIPGVIGYGILFWCMMPWSFWTGLIGTIKGLINGTDALKHVKSAYWLPFDFSGKGTQKNRIAIGSFVDQLTTSALIKNPIVTAVSTVSIPWQYSDWRNVQNTEIQIFIPLIGVINVPASAVKGHNVITFKWGCNMFSGDLAVRVQCGDVTLGSYGTNVMMPILVGDSNPNIGAAVNTVVATAGTIAAGVATGGVGAAAVGGLVAAANSGLNCIQPISTCVGGIGGGCGDALGGQIVCTTICHNTSDNPSDLISIIGTPTNVLKTLTGSGFCQTMQAHMNMSAVTGESYPTEQEVQLVNSALDSGVFLE